MCLRASLILHNSIVLLLYYSIALCGALRTYMDLRHTNTVLTNFDQEKHGRYMRW